MAPLKDRISSPLEAGTSILDAHHLPSHLNEALEYASKRLARKALHVTLVVVRREYQLPSVLPACSSPGLSPPTSPGPPSASSARFAFTSSPVASFKKLVRTGTGSMLPPLPSPTPTDGMRSGMSSPAFSAYSVDSTGPKLRWPRSPAVPLSPPPMTPSTVSSTLTDSSGPMSPNPFGIRLIHADLLTDKQERILRQTIERAERKFHIGTDWLSPAVDASACGLTASLIRRSIIQNEVLFSSEGLALLSLDRLYTFKSALSSYSRTSSPLRLEDAVDELRRLVLSGGGKKVSKSDLLRSYDWLGVTDSALADVDRMYRRAYGGVDKAGAIEGVGSTAQVTEMVKELEEEVDGMIAIAMDTIKIGKPPSPKGPALKLQTAFDPKTKSKETQDDSSEDEEELTARPSSNRGGICLWSPVSIAEILHDERAPSVMGPMTPNDYDDISPITRGEWGFLMGPNSWQGGRTAAVETC